MNGGVHLLSNGGVQQLSNGGVQLFVSIRVCGYVYVACAWRVCGVVWRVRVAYWKTFSTIPIGVPFAASFSM
mgnify:CR=1 FL=1